MQELNTKDALVAAPGAAGITVESLAGTCVLSAGGPAHHSAAGAPAQQKGIGVHLSGRIGHVMLLSHGGPVKLYLPHTAGEDVAFSFTRRMQIAGDCTRGRISCRPYHAPVKHALRMHEALFVFSLPMILTLEPTGNVHGCPWSDHHSQHACLLLQIKP